jgi:hypothetical protein
MNIYALTKTLAVASFVLVTVTCFSQQQVVLKIVFKPNKTYRTFIKTTTKSEMDISGNQEIIDQLKGSGIKIPMVVSGSSEMTTITTTGNYSQDHRIPAKIVFDKWTTIQNLNGVEKQQEQPLTGLIIEGSYSNGSQLKVDTMMSVNLDDNVRSVMKSMLEQVQQQLKFSEAPLKIGDSFDQKVPMEIPMAGLKPIKLIITTNYKLTDIKGDKALFDLIQTVTLDLAADSMNVTATGGGLGLSEFDIVNETVTRSESNLDIKMKVTMNELTIDGTANTKTLQLVTVE